MGWRFWTAATLGEAVQNLDAYLGKTVSSMFG
jgi:hypothetical protein